MAVASVQVLPTTSTGPSSPMKQCMSQAYYATPNYYSGSDRNSKRSCETAKTKRNMMHSSSQRKSVQSYNRSPALERVVTGKSSTCQSPTQVPSGSTEFTTGAAGFGAGGLYQNMQQQPHSNSPPKTGSPQKTARYLMEG